MRFDYQMYLKSDLYVPLCASLFCVVLVVSAIVGIIQHLESKARFEYVVFICFTLLLATVFVTQVIRGIPILKDRDLETLEVSGKIEKIEDITFGSRHYVGSDVRSSVYVTVNGVRYYSVTLPG